MAWHKASREFKEKGGSSKHYFETCSETLTWRSRLNAGLLLTLGASVST
jgi:hypothetical protein